MWITYKPSEQAGLCKVQCTGRVCMSLQYNCTPIFEKRHVRLYLIQCKDNTAQIIPSKSKWVHSTQHEMHPSQHIAALLSSTDLCRNAGECTHNVFGLIVDIQEWLGCTQVLSYFCILSNIMDKKTVLFDIDKREQSSACLACSQARTMLTQQPDGNSMADS